MLRNMQITKSRRPAGFFEIKKDAKIDRSRSLRLNNERRSCEIRDQNPKIRSMTELDITR